MTTSVKGFKSRVRIDSIKAGSWGNFGVTFNGPLILKEPANFRLGVKILCGVHDNQGDDFSNFLESAPLDFVSTAAGSRDLMELILTILIRDKE